MLEKKHDRPDDLAGTKASFADLLRTFLRIGFLSFGGPAGQIALMHRDLVEDRQWIDNDRFLHALNFCMLLPGPEAQQLATYTGWMLRGWRGGVIAGTLFILPGLIVMLALSAAYAIYGETDLLTGLFFGLKCAVLVIVAQASVRIGRRALKSLLHFAIAVTSFLALFLLSLPFPLIILLAGLCGYLQAGSKGPEPAANESPQIFRRPGMASQAQTVFFWLCLWAVPFLVIAAFDPGGAYGAIATFFSKMAVVTFGGAYAVLTYVAQQAVGHYHWLEPGTMLDGLGLAETTPGPLVLVLTFVGFMGAYQAPGLLPPLAGGLVGGVLAAWVTFIPCFLWIFLGAPYMEALRQNRRLSAALSAISAAVTGVIANLALWFGLHTLFGSLERWTAGAVTVLYPDPASLDPAAAALTVLTAILLFGLRLNVPLLLAISGICGILLTSLMP